MKHRADIDGLRAVAVMPVIFHHAGWSAFRGGFFGVDVFFVISGYLITGIIASELAEGRFSIARFYERRARRILPALLVVMAACIPAAQVLMTPPQVEELARSVLATLLFASNVFFWSETGYFDAAAGTKPLLHTWSLAVEEQFYILFPLILMALWRWGASLRAVIWVVGGLAAASLLAMEVSRELRLVAPSSLFYLAHFRAWELLAGALCALVAMRTGRRSVPILALVGLALVAVPMVVLPGGVPVPSAASAVPVLGTCLVIFFGGGGGLADRILCLRPMVWTGLLSYSAYLWHQPVFAFARALSLDEPPVALLLALIALILVLSWITWRYVEQPFRGRGRFGRAPRSVVFAASGGAMAAAAVVAVVLGLAASRPGAGPIATYEWDNKSLGEESWTLLREEVGDPDYFITANEVDGALWFDPSRPGARVLIIGNSHSKDLWNVAAYARDQVDAQFARYGAQLRELDAGHDFWTAENLEAATDIWLATQYLDADVEALPALIAALHARDKAVTVIGNAPEIAGDTGATVADKLLVRDRPESAEEREALADRLETIHWELLQDNEPLSALNERLAAIAAATGARFLERTPLQCDPGEGRCLALSDGLDKAIYDYGHLTMWGARRAADRAREIGWFERALGTRAAY